MKSDYLVRHDEGMAVVKSVCAARGVQVSHVRSARRHQALVAARREIALWLRAADWSTPQIGYLLRRDHSTIVQMTAPAAHRARRKARQAAQYLESKAA